MAATRCERLAVGSGDDDAMLALLARLLWGSYAVFHQPKPENGIMLATC